MQNTEATKIANTWKAIKLVPGGPEATVSPKGPTKIKANLRGPGTWVCHDHTRTVARTEG